MTRITRLATGGAARALAASHLKASPNRGRHFDLIVSPTWAGSAWQSESTFHQLSPYIGKTKSSMASWLIKRYSYRGDLIYDPFSGCGTIAYEAWRCGRRVVANDLSPYAALLTRAKLFPYETLERALEDFHRIQNRLERHGTAPDLRYVPRWVREFFHPETLREAMAWSDELKRDRCWFMLSCLMGILHHQRPGFLSFPSSHTVPYLRLRKFPRRKFPKLYEYRSVSERLEAKIRRAFRRVPKLDFEIGRSAHATRAERLVPRETVDAIITSPPYMRQLDYGRDNRLRLWFLGCADSDSLDEAISPREHAFLELMRRCFRRWGRTLRPGGNCVLVLGDTSSRSRHKDLPQTVARIAVEEAGFRVVSARSDLIPNERRVRRGITGSTAETVLVLRKARRHPARARRRERNAATL